MNSCGTVRIRHTRRGACVCRVLCAELEAALCFCSCLLIGVCEWCGCDVLLADASCVAICCVQLATLRQVYNVKYHDTYLNTVFWVRGECSTSILIRESMMCSLTLEAAGVQHTHGQV